MAERIDRSEPISSRSPRRSRRSYRTTASSALTDEAAQLRASAAVLTGFYLALSSVGLLVGLVFLALVLLRRVEAERRTIGIQRAHRRARAPGRGRVARPQPDARRRRHRPGASSPAGDLHRRCSPATAKVPRRRPRSSPCSTAVGPGSPRAGDPRARRPRGAGGDARRPATADHGGAPVTSPPPRLRLEGVTKTLPSRPTGGGARARRARPRDRPARVRFDRRPLRLREDHAAQPARPARRADRPGGSSGTGAPSRRGRERERTRLRLEGVGFIFQRFYLVPTMTALENVELAAPRRAPPGDRAAARGGVAAGGRGPLRAALVVPPRALGRRGAAGRDRPGARERPRPPPRRRADRASSTPRTPRGSSTSIGTIQRRRRLTTVLVTHNPRVAARARRHLTMQDGRIVRDTSDRPEA